MTNDKADKLLCARTLEAAAKVADRYREEAGGSIGYGAACRHIAEAIRTLSPPETELSAPTRRMEEILNAKLTPRKATPAPETGELVERIKAGLDLANRLSGDVPITAAARKQLTDAYAALASIPEVYGKSHTPETGELVERVAAALEPELFSDDPQVRHRSASPLKVEVAQERVREKARAALASIPHSPRLYTEIDAQFGRENPVTVTLHKDGGYSVEGRPEAIVPGEAPETGELVNLVPLDNLLRYHETGGYEGDGSDRALREARAALASIPSVSAQGDKSCAE